MGGTCLLKGQSTQVGDRAGQKDYNICGTIFIRRKSEVSELRLGALCICSVFVLGDGHSR